MPRLWFHMSDFGLLWAILCVLLFTIWLYRNRHLSRRALGHRDIMQSCKLCKSMRTITIPRTNMREMDMGGFGHILDLNVSEFILRHTFFIYWWHFSRLVSFICGSSIAQELRRIWALGRAIISNANTSPPNTDIKLSMNAFRSVLKWIFPSCRGQRRLDTTT